MVNCKKVKYSGLNGSNWISQEDKKIRKNSQARKFSEIAVTITSINVNNKDLHLYHIVEDFRFKFSQK